MHLSKYERSRLRTITYYSVSLSPSKNTHSLHSCYVNNSTRGDPPFPSPGLYKAFSTSLLSNQLPLSLLHINKEAKTKPFKESQNRTHFEATILTTHNFENVFFHGDCGGFSEMGRWQSYSAAIIVFSKLHTHDKSCPTKAQRFLCASHSSCSPLPKAIPQLSSHCR